MGIYRMYTGSDNETHIEELPLSAHPELGELQTVKGLQIQQNQAMRLAQFGVLARRRTLSHHSVSCSRIAGERKPSVSPSLASSGLRKQSGIHRSSGLTLAKGRTN